MDYQYYIRDDSTCKLVEVTKEEYEAFNKNQVLMPYVKGVYSGEMTIDDVPEEYQENVLQLVTEKINTQGMYEDQPIPADEALSLMEDSI